jgi:uncharacterized SAM-binding protein YcdF (DUF218 family)
MNSSRRRMAASLLTFGAGIALACFGAAKSGQFLVVDNPKRSDLIIVLSEDFNDDRAERGLTLLRAGYAQQLLLNAPDRVHYGRRQTEAAKDYLSKAAPDQASQVSVCRISSDSTRREMTQVAGCIQRIAPNATSGLLVTSDYLTRRSLDTAQRLLPRYQWSVAAARELDLGSRWWQNRESAKIVVTEWQRLLWWIVVDQWTAK